MKRNSWLEYAYLEHEDSLKDNLEQPVRHQSSVMKLPAKDMHLYGRYPGQEKLILITCKICGMRLKPQSYESHMEIRHTNMNGSSISESALLNCISQPLLSDQHIKYVVNSTNCSLSGSKNINKAMSNKLTIDDEPYARQSSLNVSSRCSTSTAMFSDMNGSLCSPQIRICDIKSKFDKYKKFENIDVIHERNKNNTSPKAIMLPKDFPKKKLRQSIKRLKQESQVHQKSKKITDRSITKNNKSLKVNGISCSSFKQHSPSIRPISSSISLRSNEQVNSHSFSCESQILTSLLPHNTNIASHNTAIGT